MFFYGTPLEIAFQAIVLLGVVLIFGVAAIAPLFGKSIKKLTHE